MSGQLAWFKSSHSNTEGGACVEVATCPRTVHVLDSKQGTTGPQLAFLAREWAAFPRSGHGMWAGARSESRGADG